ncbi:MAG: tRNA 2-thiouridine(34) synthase MnmA [Gammaproteobacteria bacterium]|nr:tRNA 2-thiouridine(34) synthase MnmA [Gammaproteobacteria bacterium]
MPEKIEKIMVGLSGGVDSSVTVLLLKEQGYHVEALFMKNWEEDDDSEYCAAAVDLKDAESVAQTLKVALHRVNFSADYWERVFEHFLAEYQAGRTPNPDILCNKEIKFKAFLEYAQRLGADHIATGHYVRRDFVGGHYRLLKGRDPEKDQSYFLYTLGQQQLRHALFPVGELHKAEVREIAERHQLSTHNKKDSTGICFIGERKFRDFLSRYLPAQPGDIVTPEDAVIGRHSGLMYYTLGQRQGLGIGGVAGYPDEPWFVVAKVLDRNLLIAAQGHDHPLLFCTTLTASQLHWVSGTPPTTPYHCRAKVRYRQQDQACTITQLVGNHCTVTFAEPQRAVTAGQSVVFYEGDVCLGGGIIDSTNQPEVALPR